VARLLPEYYLLGNYLDRLRPGRAAQTGGEGERDHVEVRAAQRLLVTNATADPENSRNNDLASALKSPLDYTSLPLLAHWGPSSRPRLLARKRVNYDMRMAQTLQ